MVYDLVVRQGGFGLPRYPFLGGCDGAERQRGGCRFVLWECKRGIGILDALLTLARSVSYDARWVLWPVRICLINFERAFKGIGRGGIRCVLSSIAVYVYILIFSFSLAWLRSYDLIIHPRFVDTECIEMADHEWETCYTDSCKRTKAEDYITSTRRAPRRFYAICVQSVWVS